MFLKKSFSLLIKYTGKITRKTEWRICTLNCRTNDFIYPRKMKSQPGILIRHFTAACQKCCTHNIFPFLRVLFMHTAFYITIFLHWWWMLQKELSLFDCFVRENCDFLSQKKETVHTVTLIWLHYRQCLNGTSTSSFSSWFMKSSGNGLQRVRLCGAHNRQTLNLSIYFYLQQLRLFVHKGILPSHNAMGQADSLRRQPPPPPKADPQKADTPQIRSTDWRYAY